MGGEGVAVHVCPDACTVAGPEHGFATISFTFKNTDYLWDIGR